MAAGVATFDGRSPATQPKTASRDEGSALESEIDASLASLELEGPTGTTLPGDLQKSTLSQSGETLARDEVPSTLDAPAGSSGGRATRPPVTFNVGEEQTQSGAVVPHTIRDSFRPSGGREPLATERPVTMTDGGENLHSAPVTLPPATEGATNGPSTNPEGHHAINDAPTGESAAAHEEELGSGELVDADEHTGAGLAIEQALESTLAAGARTGKHGDEDEIVIADDLAEDIEDDKSNPTLTDDEEEHTDAGATVPPFRSGS